MSAAPPPRFDHLLHMTDGRGTFEHAKLTEPRPEHGYCTDDMARVLVVSTREPHPDRAVKDLVALSLRFLGDAQGVDGDYRNRMSERGRWEDRPTLEDCWGRSVWALGTAAAHAEDDWVRQVAVGPVRARRAPALAVAAGDGLRCRRRRRAAGGEARTSRGAGAARRPRATCCRPSTTTRRGRGRSRRWPTPTPSSPRR